MSSQLRLFDAPLARTTDPATSQKAAAEIMPHLSQLHEWAIRCVRQAHGMTQRELGKLYCPDDPRRIGRRLKECERMGLVKRGGSRRCSVSGRKAETWWPA